MVYFVSFYIVICFNKANSNITTNKISHDEQREALAGRPGADAVAVDTGLEANKGTKTLRIVP